MNTEIIAAYDRFIPLIDAITALERAWILELPTAEIEPLIFSFAMSEASFLAIHDRAGKSLMVSTVCPGGRFANRFGWDVFEHTGKTVAVAMATTLIPRIIEGNLKVQPSDNWLPLLRDTSPAAI